MPQYELACLAFMKKFSVVLSVSQYEKRKFKCPKCGTQKLEQGWITVYAITSKKSYGNLGNARLRASVVNAKDLQRYKRLLLAKLDELSATRSGAETPVPGADERPGDPVDQANSDTEAELQVRLHQSDARLLRAIEEALVRIRQGTFGVCEVCQQPISKARLEAVPWTRLCRECKERQSS